MTPIEEHLRTALRLATETVAAGQFPFAGLVVADDGAGEILGSGVNTVRRDADPTAHGEAEAIRAACRRGGALDLSGAVVVASCQPCPMCQAVTALVGIERIVFAASRTDAAVAGFRFPEPTAEPVTTADGALVRLEQVEVPGAAAPFDAWRASGSGMATQARPVHELRVSVTAPDFDAAVAFYRDAFGLPQLADWSTPDGRVVVLDGGRATLELVDLAQAGFIDSVEVGRRVAGPIRLAMSVDDAAATAEALVGAGARYLGAGPVVTPWRDRNVRLAAPPDLQLTLFTPLD